MTVTPEQRERALVRADTMRLGRVELRRRVKALGRSEGSEVVADLLLASPPCLHSAYVWQVVNWVRSVGGESGPLLLRAAKVDAWCRVGRMSDRQRETLAAALRRYGRHDPPRRGYGTICKVCGEHLRQRSESGLCGFCEAGL